VGEEEGEGEEGQEEGEGEEKGEVAAREKIMLHHSDNSS
jgi:hypothetical protein